MVMKNLNCIEERIADAIISECELGNADNEWFYTEIETGDLFIEVSGHYWTEGYCEDDYYDGTGAWVATDATVSIDYIKAYNEDGDRIELDIDEFLIVEAVEKELIF